MSAPLSSGPGLTGTSPRPIESEHRAVDPLDAILSLVADENRFDLARISPATVRRHVADRMRQRSIGSTSEYLALLRRNSPEVLALRTALLANGTVFFRDPKVWDFVAHDLIPRLMARTRPFRPLRVWVPHCGAGAEAYTLAMLLLEHPFRAPVPVQLFACDADGSAIDVARSGRVPWIAGTAIGPARLGRFFVSTQDGYQVRHELRSAVSFAQHDLLSDLPFLHMDLICCRYLLMHLRPPARLAVASLLHQSLDNGGYLVLGTAEHLGHAAGPFEVVSRRWSVLRRSSRALPGPSASIPRPDPVRATIAAPARALHEPPASSPPAAKRNHYGSMARMLRLMSMGKLAASLAHELSQPLTALANVLEACAIHLRTGNATREQLLDLTQQASSQSHRAGRIVAHITRLLHDGERRVERCELRTLVRTAAELLRSTLLECDIELQLVLGDVPLWGSLCRVEIEQVVMNLLQNAIDAIVEGGEDRRQIRVEVAEAPGERATVTVSDTGKGISLAVAERLFEPFFTTKDDGFGMGTTICRAIVHAHGGRLWIDRTSDVDATRMCFSLPVARRRPTAASAT
jgi:chemotaxis methyl-accepting protein methylase/signal transduction histidine kinase